MWWRSIGATCDLLMLACLTGRPATFYNGRMTIEIEDGKRHMIERLSHPPTARTGCTITHMSRYPGYLIESPAVAHARRNGSETRKRLDRLPRSACIALLMTMPTGSGRTLSPCSAICSSNDSGEVQFSR